MEPQKMEIITIEVKGWEAKIARSPVFWFVASVTGVFCTFAPLFLYWAGKQGVPMTSPRVLSLLALIYFVSLFYISFGSKVVIKLRESKTT
jgi:hypothetical protein